MSIASTLHPSERGLRIKPILIAGQIRIAGFLLAALVLLISPFDTIFGLFDALYPAGTAPRTHPLTWTCLLLAMIATINQRPLRTSTSIEIFMWVSVLVLASVKSWLGPAVDQLVPEVRLGSMGWNTALAFGLVALGQLLRQSQPALAMVCAIGGVFLACVALNGLVLGNHDFYGEMAAPTAFAIFGIGLANLLRFSRRSGFRLILSDTAAGRLVRRQVMLWVGLACLMPLALRTMQFSDGASFALLYTAQMAAVLVGILYFGVRFAGLLDNAQRLERELVRDAETDPLTGAATRRAAISYFVKNSWRTTMGVVLLDLDHFKQVNDEHGHSVGDQVLQAVVRALRKELRVTDLIVRWGGEELLVLIPASDAKILRVRADALRIAIQMETAADPSIPGVTASFGVSIAKAGMEPDMSAVLDQADEALYQAKSDGRNRVVMFSKTKTRLSVVKAA